MQDSENNKWIILDRLGKTYEIYANMTVMIILNLNHCWITQPTLCLKGTFAKASFTFATIF